MSDKKFAEYIEKRCCSLLLVLSVIWMTGCGKQTDIPLTQDELQNFENMFVCNDMSRRFEPMLLSSEYSSPEEIHIGWLFREGIPNRDGGWGYEISKEEMDALRNALPAEEYESFLTADPSKIPAAEMSAMLQQYLGLKLEDTQMRGMDFFTYLEEYQAFYSCASDTMSVIPDFTSGLRRKNGTVELRYHSQNFWDGVEHEAPDTHILVLRPTENGYLFLSNEKIDVHMS